MSGNLVDMTDVTVCAPCDQGAKHPESHAEGTRVLLADRVSGEHDEQAAAALVHGVRNGLKVSGPMTVHQGPADDINTVTGEPVREWVATQP